MGGSGIQLKIEKNWWKFEKFGKFTCIRYWSTNSVNFKNRSIIENVWHFWRFLPQTKLSTKLFLFFRYTVYPWKHVDVFSKKIQVKFFLIKIIVSPLTIVYESYNMIHKRVATQGQSQACGWLSICNDELQIVVNFGKCREVSLQSNRSCCRRLTYRSRLKFFLEFSFCKKNCRRSTLNSWPVVIGQNTWPKCDSQSENVNKIGSNSCHIWIIWYAQMLMCPKFGLLSSYKNVKF